MKKFSNFLLAPLAIITMTLEAQDSLQQKISLKEITLDAVRIKTPKRIIPFAISHRSFKADQLGLSQNSLQDYLNTVPGLYAQNTQNFAQDLRLSIRGFGARSGFGIRGIKLIVDGIPETTPDGQGQLDNLPLGLIQSLTVLRGPASSFYGNASGGVIQINTLEGFKDNFIRLRLQGGSFSSRNLAATIGLKNNKTKAVFYQNHSESQGYRNHSRYKQQVFNARVWHDLSVSSQIRWQFNYTNSPYAYDAGGINLDMVKENAKQARPQNETYNTYETINHLKTGLQWEKQINDNLRWDSYAFYAHRDFVGRLPFGFGGFVDLKRDYYGLGTAMEYQPQKHHRMQLRFSLADQKDHRQRFKNLNGSSGENTLDQDELFFNTALSFLDELKWDFGLLRLGLRYDYQRLSTQRERDEVQLNSLNPSLGFTYTQLGNNVIFVSYSSSFETPTLNELSANPIANVGFNPNLSPSKAHNFELGWRYTTPQNKVEATIYAINTQNEILPYELADFPDRDFYRNTGSTSRRGIELFWEHQRGSWEWMASYNYASLKFDNYVLGDKNLGGNKLPGVPEQQFSASLEYNFLGGWGAALQSQYSGNLYADDANQTRVEDYFLVNFRFWKSLEKISFFCGINNLLDETYFDNIRINAYGKRHYEPAPMRNFYLGITLSL
uniref:TonB-dependent outer membrane receptor n=1 Tax=uncultured Flavobacteriia bacterium TaxID=212695 RepID=H6REP5_9BACT|nr:TonB-dependent outer membrane receptor [uncultured Flavobacteriia bacterium]